MLDSLSVGDWYDRTVLGDQWQEAKRNALTDRVWAVQKRRSLELDDLYELLRDVRAKREAVSVGAEDAWRNARRRRRFIGVSVALVSAVGWIVGPATGLNALVIVADIGVSVLSWAVPVAAGRMPAQSARKKRPVPGEPLSLKEGAEVVWDAEHR